MVKHFILDTAESSRQQKQTSAAALTVEKPPKYVALCSIWQSWENTQISNPSC